MSSYIYMDESGDLGFNLNNKKTSRYFVVSFLFVQDKQQIQKIVKKIFRGFNKVEVRSHHGVLHCYKEKPKTRLRVLQELARQDISLLVIYLNKKNVRTKLQDEKHVLYNYITNILLDRTIRKKLLPKDSQITLIASKRETNVFLNENFRSYLTDQVKAKHNHKLEVVIKTPSQDKGLQIVDFCAWSMFRKYEHNDESYAKIIKNKVVEENGLFV